MFACRFLCILENGEYSVLLKELTFHNIPIFVKRNKPSIWKLNDEMIICWFGKEKQEHWNGYNTSSMPDECTNI